MPAFTKFGVWEMEMSEFIDVAAAKLPISKSELTDWLYDEGLSALQGGQSRYYHTLVNEYKAKHNNVLPVITAEEMKQQKVVGFQAVLDALKKKFLFQPPFAQQFEDLYQQIILDKAVNQHMKFYTLQAEITNLTHEIEKNQPSITIKEKFTIVLELFAAYKNGAYNLNEEIDAHLLLMNEFALKLKLFTPASTAPHASAFKPEAANLATSPSSDTAPTIRFGQQ